MRAFYHNVLVAFVRLVIGNKNFQVTQYQTLINISLNKVIYETTHEIEAKKKKAMHTSPEEKIIVNIFWFSMIADEICPRDWN